MIVMTALVTILVGLASSSRNSITVSLLWCFSLPIEVPIEQVIFPDRNKLLLLVKSNRFCGVTFLGLNNTIQVADVSATISSVVASLDPHFTHLWDARKDRKFSLVEMSFLWRWWRTQNISVQQLFKSHVERHAIEIVSGGWVMHDEAVTHYIDIIDQVQILSYC